MRGLPSERGPMAPGGPGQNGPKSSVPVSRWTRPGFLSRLCGPRKVEGFVFDGLADAHSAIPLDIDGAHLVWEDGSWLHRGPDYEAGRVRLTEDEEAALADENGGLSAQVEILLDTNTSYELKRAALREKLAALEQQIRSFPGLDDYSDSF